MASINQQGPHYEQGRGYESSYQYEEPVDPQIPRHYPDAFESHPAPAPLSHSRVSEEQQQQQQQHQPHGPQAYGKSGIRTSEPRPRLRKACDSCSVRKVKCDESGPPCKSCAVLDIPCTFERPSRRRGPPNRHAEAIKRQKLETGGILSAGSPTHDAAWGLTTLSLPTMLSAESICDLGTLEVLINDYFIYIHPLIPVPHEPSFRAAFARREDKSDRIFLGMIAAMVETLVASFPRRARRLFTSEQAKHRYPNAGALIDHCHAIFIEARGVGYLDREPSMNEAISSYLAGITASYLFDVRRTRMYWAESLMMIRSMGFRPGSMASAPEQQQAGPVTVDHVFQQSGRRVFWLIFVGAMSSRQLEESEGDLLMPPVASSERLPPLPAEVDDQYISHESIFPQQEGVVSELAGFNLNCQVYCAFHRLAAIEAVYGADTVYDWDRQKQIIKRALQAVKAAVANAPKELQLNTAAEFGEWPPRSYDSSVYSMPSLAMGGQYPHLDGQHDPLTLGLPFSRREIQHEIQKANIYASLLATRSYLVERYWNLYEIHEQERTKQPNQASPVSLMPSAPLPTVVIGDPQFTGSLNQTTQSPSDTGTDAIEQSMAVEREDIVRDLAVLLKSINQVNMEPNGLSFCNKIRQIASTLLEPKKSQRNVMPTLDSTRVNDYLIDFLEILNKLQRLGAGRIRPDEAGAMGLGKSPEEIEEEELVHWASLKEHQERFLRSEEILLV